jgi:uracil-DNA glycosylase
MTGREGTKPLISLRREIISCRKCPRLVRYRETLEPRRAYEGEAYWRRPVAGFGDIGARLLVLGLSPAAHGGNRTGRVFTGDGSGRFLVRALYATGFANAPVSESREDGLVYRDCYLTAAVKCAPPGDRPTREEFANCSSYLDDEIGLLPNLQAVVALGGLSFRAFLDHLGRSGERPGGLKFRHGAVYRVGGIRLYACYHPSPRNTNTGKLTLAMLISVMRRARAGLR